MTRQSILYLYLLLSSLQIPIGGGLIRSPESTTVFFLGVDLIFFAVAFLFLVRRNFKIDATLKSIIILYALFFSLAIASSTWSESGRTGYSFALVIRECLRFAVIVFLAPSKFDTTSFVAIQKAFVHAAFLYCSIFLVTASYAFDFENSQGRLMYVGFKDANQPARDLSLFLIFAIWMHQEKLIGRRKAFFLVGLLSVTFALCFSKTSLAALILSLLYLKLFKREELSRKATGIFLASLLLAGVAIYRLEYFFQYINEVQGGSALATLSGRTLIWEIYFENIPQFWIFGAGIDSFRSYSTALPNNPGTVHNEFMNISFNYGVVGLGVYISILLYFVMAVRKTSPSGKQVAFSTLLFFLMTGITESDLVSSIFSPYLLLLFFIIARETSKWRSV